MTDLFALEERAAAPDDRPLPDRLRPRTLDQIVGQNHLVGPGAPIRQMLLLGEAPARRLPHRQRRVYFAVG